MWKDIKGFEGIYQVSDKGEVRRIFKKGRTKLLKMRGGYYPTVTLSIHCTKKSFAVHRLVAETFLERPVEATEVNHKDGNRWNNDLSNLEWVTQQQNIDHAKNQLKIYGKAPRRVKCLDVITGEEIAEYPSVSDAARMVGTYSARQGIISCCTGTRITAYGYRWKYAD